MFLSNGPSERKKEAIEARTLVPAKSRPLRDALFGQRRVSMVMLDLARHIVEQKSGSFEPDRFDDRYETALVDLINKKRAGTPITPKERPRGENVVDLMEALRRGSVVARPRPGSRRSRPRNPRRPRPARRKC